jgi:rod shape-determining protein MreC
MNRLVIVLVAVILIVAVYLSTLGSGTVQNLQRGFLGWLSPFFRTGSGIQTQLGSVGEKMKSYDELKAEHARLTTENKELRAMNLILRDMEAENNKLKDALAYQKNSVFKLVPARVIAREASTWWNIVRINRGFEDGIEENQPVLTDLGLVGKTVTVGKNMTTVLLITDESCKVAAKVEGSRESGILSGMRIQESAGVGELQLNFLTKMADLQPGQKIYTAGVSNGVFPSGVLLGTVKSFKVRSLDGQAIAEPAVDLSSVEDVFVVVGAK